MPARELFSALIQATGEAVWDWRIPEGRLEWHNSAYTSTLGIDELVRSADLAAWEERLHPDDRERVTQSLSAAAAGSATSWTAEYRLRRDDGTWALVVDRATVVHGDDGLPVRMVGTLRDVTEARRTSAELREARDYADAILAMLPGTFYHVSSTGRILRWNRNFVTESGYSEEEVREMAALDFYFPEDRGQIAGVLRDVLERGYGEVVAPMRRKDGRAIPYMSTGQRFVHRGEEGLIGVGIDITEQVTLQRALVAARDYSDAVLASLPGPFYHVGAGLRMVRWNAKFAEATGYSDAEIAELTALDFVPPEDVEQVRAAIDEVLTKGSGSVQSHFLRKDGHTLPYLFTGQRFAYEETVGYVGVALDMTEEVALHEALRHQAEHDPLTGLANRTCLHIALDKAMAESRRSGQQVAVLDLDLDRFKVVNDGFGHPFGDLVLRAVAERLTSLVCPEDLVARLGGDEFVILTPQVRRATDIDEMAQRVVDSFAEPFVVEGRRIYLTGSIGVSLYPRDGTTGTELIDNADVAMYYAKDAGRSAFRSFARHMADETQRKIEWETQLRGAAEAGQLSLAYQPKVDLATGSIVGCEALLRWDHPELGRVAPSDFIPVAEDSGLIVPIGEWVLTEACRQGRAWLDQGLAPLPIAVNISAGQLLHRDPAAWVASTLARTGFLAHLLELELTESQLAQDAETTIGAVRALRALGVTLAIDDFGTGYSSLSYLKRFDVTTLKIDRSFIAGMLDEPGDAAIVRAAVALGHALGLNVIAEGVETDEQRSLLRWLQCDQMQGFLISEPVPAELFSALLT